MTTIEEKEWINPDQDWQTPTVTNISQRSEAAKTKRKKFRESIGRNTVPPGNLAEQVSENWATPSTMNNQNYPETNMEKRNSPSLGSQASIWGTPNQRDYKDTVTSLPPSVREKGKPGTRGKTLGMSVASHLSHLDPGTKNNGEELSQSDQTSLQRWKNLRLNPRFVEWLMGWQIGSTELTGLESSETELYLFNLQRQCEYWSHEYGVTNE